MGATGWEERNERVGKKKSSEAGFSPRGWAVVVVTSTRESYLLVPVVPANLGMKGGELDLAISPATDSSRDGQEGQGSARIQSSA